MSGLVSVGGGGAILASEIIAVTDPDDDAPAWAKAQIWLRSRETSFHSSDTPQAISTRWRKALDKDSQFMRAAFGRLDDDEVAR